jgi:hypothetical protein
MRLAILRTIKFANAFALQCCIEQIISEMNHGQPLKSSLLMKVELHLDLMLSVLDLLVPDVFEMPK